MHNDYGTPQLSDLGQVILKLSPQGWKSERPPGSPVLGIFCVEVVRSINKETGCDNVLKNIIIQASPHVQPSP